MISEAEISKLAHLSRLELSTEEIKLQAKHISTAIDHFQQIAKINTEGVEPLMTPIEIKPELREDAIKKDFESEQLLANAPHKTGNLFTVPPVV